ncbi:Rrf2 family transcriptional regulator [Paraburkholderia sp. MMS20-SJTR3]|uniref:Rrf2 family transcriptional regulator n=1 Tax=Paraburkholderia sejongensis TaxID=2886946 RepID=A0ABS8K6A7_9BURK|nr:Rrf2 family transcriptional regulator [Paraburkholderia sp. MMS20-SJTR3]MCC8397681.1 Rrf2 family transcriptional regulator [Paraburkholderia sp. MMS20-SJTR3]
MKLTDHTDYSLRVLLYLAVRGPQLSKIRDITRAYSISKNPLMRIAWQLAEHGWIETVLGPNGGLRLSGHSLDLTLGNVVRLLEGDFALAPCLPDRLGGSRECVIAPHCRLRGALQAANQAFLDELDRHTIGDLVQSRDSLAELLGLRITVPIVPATAWGDERDRVAHLRAVS